MAKRRKKTKKTGRKRSRKSTMGAIDFTNILGVVAGAIAGGYVNKLIPEGMEINPKIISGGKIALGLALPMLVKTGKMKNILAGVGSGMIAVGTIDLLKDMDILSGADEDDMLEISLNGDQDVLSGDDDLSVINGDVLAGDDDINVINGYDDMEDEY
jgi:hypothetical protein